MPLRDLLERRLPLICLEMLRCWGTLFWKLCPARGINRAHLTPVAESERRHRRLLFAGATVAHKRRKGAARRNRQRGAMWGSGTTRLLCQNCGCRLCCVPTIFTVISESRVQSRPICQTYKTRTRDDVVICRPLTSMDHSAVRPLVEPKCFLSPSDESRFVL